MGLRTSDSGKGIVLAPAGMHVGRLTRVIDCGTRTDKMFGKTKHIVLLSWELPNLPRADGGVQWVTKRYTASHNHKAILRIDLESWFGKQFDDRQLNQAGGFDLAKLIGRPALLNVVHSPDGRYVNIATVTGLPQGMACPPLMSEPVVFSLEEFDQKVFDLLSDGLRKYIMESEEYQAKLGFSSPVPGGVASGGGRSTIGMTPEQMAASARSRAAAAPPAADDLPYGEPPPHSYVKHNDDGFDDDIPF